jgi:twinkle protein
LIPYNIDSIAISKDFYLVEGEMDCLTLIEAGIKNVISVPNGAGKNLTWLDDAIEFFSGKIAIIAVDNDAKGIELKNELIRRLEPENCRVVNWVDCKDANECFLKFGKDKLLKTLLNHEVIKVSGIFDVLDFEADLDDLYFKGLQPGLGIGYDIFDSLCTFETGRLAIITGIPGHGKSEFIDELTSRLNLLHEWKCGYFSPENLPLKIHASKLIRKFSGKQFNEESLNRDLYLKSKLHIYKNFYFIVPDDSFDVDSILEKTLYLIKTRGIKVAVIDPWNRIEHQQDNGESETRYISRILDKLTNFAKRHDILIILAAHPVKMQKKDGKFEVPNLYSISGSANFFAKTDYGITIYRDEDVVEVHVQKVKFEHMGKTGLALFKRNINNGRYEQVSDVSETPMWRNYSYFDK